MRKEDTIEFELPGTGEFRTGCVESFTVHDGTVMPEVIDERHQAYPVHPGNVTEVVPRER